MLDFDVTAEGAVSLNVLYHQPLPITPHQVRFYANNFVDTIVSTAFKGAESKTILLR